MDTRLWLSADADHAAGMLLQRLPHHGGGETDRALTEQVAAETSCRSKASTVAEALQHYMRPPNSWTRVCGCQPMPITPPACCCNACRITAAE
ncbi:hypothetical protein CTI14_61750, partial [Methylobacterium radiotolerans]